MYFIMYVQIPALFRKKRFALNEIFHQNASKFAIFYVVKEKSCR